METFESLTSLQRVAIYLAGIAVNLLTAMHWILLAIANFIVEAASLNVTFDMERGIWVLMFLMLWLATTAGQVCEHPLRPYSPNR